MKKRNKKQFKPEDLREAVLRFIENQDVQSGYFGACSVPPQWLIDQGFPPDLVEPLVMDFEDAPRGVWCLKLLWKLAEIFDADTAEANKWGLARKRCCRSLAASIKAAISVMATA